MPGEAVFIDSAALIALVNRTDSLYARAIAIRDSLAATRTPFLTSDWVLAEVLATCAEPPMRARAVAAVASLRASGAATVVEATRGGWDAAFDLYRSRDDKDWSLVDCTSILICRSRSIQRVFTHDRHFAQAGFELLLP